MSNTKPIDHMSGTYLRYVEMRNNRDELDRQIKKLEAELREAVGSAHEVTIFGEVVLTYKPVNRFQEKMFASDNPVLAKEFTRPVVVDQFDVEAFKAAHPALYVQYQSRQWQVKEK